MKTKLIFEVDEREEVEALLNAVDNQVKLDTLYDSCFRSIIKYGQNKKEIKIAEAIWEKVREHLE